MVCEFWTSFGLFSIFVLFRVITEKVGLKLSRNWSSLGKIEDGLVKLDVFMNYWTIQFPEISSRVKSPNFEYRVYRAHCAIGHVGVQFRWFHSSKSYSKAFEASQYCWFSYWSLSGVLFILQAITLSLKTILQRSRTEHL